MLVQHFDEFRNRTASVAYGVDWNDGRRFFHDRFMGCSFIFFSDALSATCTHHGLRSKTKSSLPRVQMLTLDNYRQLLHATTRQPSEVQGRGVLDFL